MRGERVLVDGEFSAREIGVRDGVVARVAPLGTGLEATQTVDLAADEVLLPGLVDTHVHVNEPGRTEWEGFASATRAAAAGGVTTIVDMPLNSVPPTISVEALETKRAAADGRVFVDVGFWGGFVPGNLEHLAPLVDEGVFGFKCFLLHSGVDEFPPVTADEMEQAMEVIAEAGSMLIVHAEDAHVIDGAPHPHSVDYADFLASRPRAAEDAAIADVIERAARTGARAHILHLSSGDSLARIAAAKRDGVALSVETCPHYLTLTAEEIPAGATAFKCCPPIREAGNRDALWQGLERGELDFVVTDHSPATPELKFAGDGDFVEAWGGIASLQLGLPVVWTEARRRGIPLTRVVEWMSAAPARRVGLTAKGRIAVGAAADFAVFAPDARFTVDARALEHRHPVTPYDGRELTGEVRRTYLAGAPIDREHARGRLLRRDIAAVAGAPGPGPSPAPIAPATSPDAGTAEASDSTNRPSERSIMINSSDELEPGQLAPDFTIPDASGTARTLSSFRGGPVIVYFYPAAFTPGCTVEACDFRDNLAAFEAEGYTVLGISPDPVERLAEFAAAEQLSFPLLSDPDAEVARAWGAWGQKTVDGRTFDGLIRTTVVVDAEGRVAHLEYDVAPAGHVARLREALAGVSEAATA
nr:allantoinase AllB [Agromyces terreus]